MKINIESHFIDEVLPIVSGSATVLYLVIAKAYQENGNRPVVLSFGSLGRRTNLSMTTLKRATLELEMPGHINIDRIGIGKTTETYYSITEVRA